MLFTLEMGAKGHILFHQVFVAPCGAACSMFSFGVQRTKGTISVTFANVVFFYAQPLLQLVRDLHHRH